MRAAVAPAAGGPTAGWPACATAAAPSARSSSSCWRLALRKSTRSVPARHGVPGHERRGRAPRPCGGAPRPATMLAEPLDVLAHLVAVEPVGELGPPADRRPGRPGRLPPPGRRPRRAARAPATSRSAGGAARASGRPTSRSASAPPAASRPRPSTSTAISATCASVREVARRPAPSRAGRAGRSRSRSSPTSARAPAAPPTPAGKYRSKIMVEDLALAAAAHERRGEALAQLLAVVETEHARSRRPRRPSRWCPAGSPLLRSAADELDQPRRQVRPGQRPWRRPERRRAHRRSTASRSSRARALLEVVLVLEHRRRGCPRRPPSSRMSAPSATSVRAQSIVSETEGALRSGMARSALTTRTSDSASACVEVGHLEPDDLLLELGVGEVDVQEEAATAQRLGQLAGGVGGQHDEGAVRGRDRAELGHRDLEVAEHLEQQALDLDVGLVGLVDQQHGRARRCGSP